MSPEEAFSLIKNDVVQQDRRITRWVDLGCGTGLFTQALSRLLQAGSSIYGIDIHPSLKRQTTPNNVELIPLQLDFVTGDWAAVRQGTSREPGNSLQRLDGVLMANSLHYVKDKAAFLSKISTFLQPQATFLIVEYDTDIAVPTWVPYPASFQTLTQLFTHAGYGSIRRLAEKPSIYGGGNIYAALLNR
ncbi:MAG TPA: methyltransferase domain-containing protein [Puia sp.]|nr:methyltransferase domain-containing protein [Puia sp.]